MQVLGGQLYNLRHTQRLSCWQCSWSFGISSLLKEKKKSFYYFSYFLSFQFQANSWSCVPLS